MNCLLQVLLPRPLLCGETQKLESGGLITGAWVCGSVLPAPQRVNMLKVFPVTAAQKVATRSLSPPRIQGAKKVWTIKQKAENLC